MNLATIIVVVVFAGMGLSLALIAFGSFSPRLAKRKTPAPGYGLLIYNFSEKYSDTIVNKWAAQLINNRYFLFPDDIEVDITSYPHIVELKVKDA